jgi:hypothetical protein
MYSFSMDLPEQYLLQQGAARPVSGDELEAMGKRASAGWRSGEYPTLTHAVVGIVKRAQLSPEQVRRVVEFTNQDAYLFEFKKEGAHKVIHFDCGPADPSEVLKDLNDGGGGSVFDRGLMDYQSPPTFKQASVNGQMDKTASDTIEFNPYEEELYRMFEVAPEYTPPHDPTRESRDLWYKLAAAREDLQGQLDSLEITLGDATRALEHEVKVACREGVPLGDVLQAWSSLGPDPEFIKAAFQALTPALKRELGGYDAIGASIEKVGSLTRVVDDTHPVVQAFGAFSGTLLKLANVRACWEEVAEAHAGIEEVVKQAAVGGMVGKAWQHLGHAGEAVGEAVSPVAEALLGAHPDKVKNIARTATQVGGAGAGLLAANAAQQEITDRPGVRSAVGAAKSIVPGTQEYNMRRMRIMNGGMY